MKILFIINNLYATGNGLSASARRTIQYLKETGNEVKVLSGPNPDPDGPAPDFPLKHFSFPIFEPLIAAHGYSFANGEPKRIEEAVRWADVVHMEEPFVLQVKAVRICRRLGVPCTGTYHLHPEHIFSSLSMGGWKFLNRSLLRFWRNWVFNFCDRVQCPTQNVMDRLRRYHFKPELEVFSNGLIPDTCLRPATPPEDYEDPARPLLVVYIGRLSVEKDQPTLLEAMKHSAYAKRIQLYFAGQGPKAKSYRRKAMKLYKDGVLGYEPVFKFCSRDELRTLASRADLCVHCATIEVEGLSIMEAMQQGAVPIIAEGRYSGTSQFALDRRSRFPEKNPEALAARIDWWLSHPAERWEMGKQYAASMEPYDIRKSVKHLLDMFQHAIDNKGR